jgi:hypothetical protein
MEIVLVLTTLFGFSNQEFLNTSAEQIDQGYKWTYVGKSQPSGTPAITIETDNDEYILYRLEK